MLRVAGPPDRLVERDQLTIREKLREPFPFLGRLYGQEHSGVLKDFLEIRIVRSFGPKDRASLLAICLGVIW